MSRSKQSHTIVCLSSQPWEDGMWTNKQHIMSRLAAEHRVYYVEPGSIPIGRRVSRGVIAPPNGRRSLAGFFFDPDHKVVGGVNVLRFTRCVPGFVMQLEPASPARIFGDFDLRLRLLARYLERESLADAILWVYHPGYGEKALALPHRLAVYDCVDDYAEFPMYRGSPEWLRRREEGLCRGADVVFATSESLFAAKREYNPDNTYLVHNVGDAAHFRRAEAPTTQVPAELARLPKPVVGFVGALSPYKLNLEWLAHLARAKPGWSIALIGPVGVGEEGAKLEAIAGIPNVHLLGHKSYDSLPGYVRGFDVAVIPYVRSRYTESCFPIKFFEFLASGKPVVISDLPALSAYFDAVRVARTADEFVACCERALDNPDDGKARRIELSSENDWSSRIRKLMEENRMSTIPVGKVLLKGSLWTTVGEALSGLGMLAAGVIAARVLSPHDFGLMGTAMLALTIVDQFSQTGFHSALVQRENDVESYLDVAFTWHLLRGAFLCVLLAAISPWLGRVYAEPMLVPVMLAVAIHPLLGGASNIGQVHFHRKLDFRTLALVKLGQTALRIAIFVPAILYFKNVWALVIGVLASAVSGLIISYVSHPYRPRLRWDTERLRELIRYGKWLTGFAAIAFFITFGDNIFVSKYFGLAALGVYQLGFEVANYPTTHVTHVLGRIAFPTYARLQQDKDELVRAFVQVMRAAFLVSASVSALLFVAANDLVQHILGAKWQTAIPLIRILVIAGVIRSFTATGGPLFHAVGRADLDFKMNLPRFLVTVAGLWPAAHWFGINGVCYVVLLAVGTTLPTWFVGLRRLVGLSAGVIVRENLLAVLSAALLIASYELVRPRFGAGPWHAVFGLSSSLFVWLGALWLLGRFTPYDFFAEIRRLREAMRKR